jgi:hypothetical protein
MMSKEEAQEIVENLEEELDELESAKKQLDAAVLTAQHYALVATQAVHLLGGEMRFGAEEVEGLKQLVMVQRLEDDNKLLYKVVTVEEAAQMLKERNEAQAIAEEKAKAEAEVKEASEGVENE